MVRCYKSVGKKKQWSLTNLRAAVNAVNQQGFSKNRAAIEYGVPRQTLNRYLRCPEHDVRENTMPTGTVFSRQQEEDLMQYLLDMDKRLYGLSLRDLRSVAYQLAEKNHIKHRFSRKTQLAGYDWACGFRKRHPQLALRSPEPTSVARAQGFNKVAVNGFFDILEDIFDNTRFPPSRIYNVDETSILTVQTKTSKVISLKGKRQVGCIASADRGVLSTACICMSAAGHFIPPMLIFPRVRLTGQLKKGAPPETLFSCNTTGWMTIDDFSAWFDHFLAHTRPTAESPVLLLLDGHASHTKNLEFLDKAKRSHVTVVSMPPHCSHRLQPLDVSFMGPLKTNLSQVIEKYLKMNPGKVITLNEISALFGKAYLRSTSASVAVNGFNKTGIAPFNRAVFTDDDFAPADVSDIPLTSNGGSSSNETTTEDKNRQQFQGVNDGLATIDLTKTLPNTVEGSQCDVHSDDEDGPFLGFEDVDMTTKKITGIPTKRSTQLNKSFSVGPTAIRPFPKMALKERKSGRKKEKSKELTSSLLGGVRGSITKNQFLEYCCSTHSKLEIYWFFKFTTLHVLQ